MKKIAVRFENICKRYNGPKRKPLRDFLAGKLVDRVSLKPRHRNSEDEIWALKDVSFEIEQGEVIGFVGANGAGKSTLLKIVSRITKPTSGFGEITGRVASLLEVGTGFHPDLTGRENVYLSGSILGMKRSEIDQRFDDIVEFSGVGSQIGMQVKFYSSGQHVRLGFSVLAHLEQEILILDEVLAVGDQDFREKCLKKMHELAGSGRTVLLVSHQLESLEKLCDKVIWLDRGQVVEFGETQKVLDAYRNSKALL
ncbi:MAG TPA: ABC transporter ATP-binding protein [Drouetiella sp.]